MTAPELDLDAIAARADAATPGPWKRQPSLSLDSCVESDVGESPGVPAVCFDVSGLNARNDADFIAAARADVPALVLAVRARDAEIARLRDVNVDARRRLDDRAHSEHAMQARCAAAEAEIERIDKASAAALNVLARSNAALTEERDTLHTDYRAALAEIATLRAQVAEAAAREKVLADTVADAHRLRNVERLAREFMECKGSLAECVEAADALEAALATIVGEQGGRT